MISPKRRPRVLDDEGGDALALEEGIYKFGEEELELGLKMRRKMMFLFSLSYSHLSKNEEKR